MLQPVSKSGQLLSPVNEKRNVVNAFAFLLKKARPFVCSHYCYFLSTKYYFHSGLFSKANCIQMLEIAKGLYSFGLIW